MLSFISGCLGCSSGRYAVFPHGSFLLDARGGNLPLLVCCQGLQHQQQDEHVLRHVMG